MRILVVDDQRTIGLALCGTLTQLGHQPQLVTSSVAAFELIERGDRRMVITDWMMPDMDGPELCRKIRAAKRYPYTYILMVTGRTDRLDRLAGLAAGADDFLSKPVDEEELVVRLAIAERILGVQAELEAKNARLEEMAKLDPLTGLANRRRLAEGIETVLAGGEVATPLSVLAIDVDHFKSYNDEFGHQAGDEVLRMIAATLRANTRSGDLVARSGGEEFIVLLPGVDAGVAESIAESLRAAIESQDWPHRCVTASFGIGTVWNSAELTDISALFNAADGALYQSKNAGRNRVTHAGYCDHITNPPSAPAHGNSVSPRSDSIRRSPHNSPFMPSSWK
jgi:two-component system, cell cycle response regulator